MPNVPRVKEITGRESREDVAARKEWEALRMRFEVTKRQSGKAGLAAWKERIRRTRSA